ncbi:hypothetical protein PRIPAC_81478 [Pristionchus pacificus]|nr:hypothetical protein PRIPAC_81478 [Pristionchus pacificus]
MQRNAISEQTRKHQRKLTLRLVAQTAILTLFFGLPILVCVCSSSSELFNTSTCVIAVWILSMHSTAQSLFMIFVSETYRNINLRQVFAWLHHYSTLTDGSELPGILDMPRMHGNAIGINDEF